MLRHLLKSKIHRATMTGADLNYVGSISGDQDLVDRAGSLEYEQVHVVNVTTGARSRPYAMSATAGSGTVALNGGAARLGQPGELAIILAYAYFGPEELAGFRPKLVFVDEKNRVVEEPHKGKLNTRTGPSAKNVSGKRRILPPR